jgi:hypothetical protein
MSMLPVYNMTRILFKTLMMVASVLCGWVALNGSLQFSQRE